MPVLNMMFIFASTVREGDNHFQLWKWTWGRRDAWAFRRAIPHFSHARRERGCGRTVRVLSLDPSLAFERGPKRLLDGQHHEADAHAQHGEQREERLSRPPRIEDADRAAQEVAEEARHEPHAH